MIQKIYKNWIEILWNLIIRYLLLFIISFLTQSFTELNKEEIIYLVNSVIWCEIILYEIWNFNKTNFSYLFGVILSWLFLISYMNFLILDWKEYEILIILQIFETIISLFWLGFGKIPNHKLLISENDKDDENNTLNFH